MHAWFVPPVNALFEFSREPARGPLGQQDAVLVGNGDTAIVFVVIAAVIGIAGLIIWLAYMFEKKRTEAMRSVASDIGLEFSAHADSQLLAKLAVFALFNKGHSRKMKNVMKAETEVAKLTIFDYQYTTGHGKHSHTYNHTMVAMESGKLHLPNFTLRPEGFFDKIGSAIGFQDIDFENHPEFSKAYVLKGENEPAIREFFDQEMLDTFARQKGITVESAPGIFIYLESGRKKPDQIHQFMNDGYGIYTAFVERISSRE